MSERQRSTLLAYLRRLAGSVASNCNDAELLERFASQRDEAAFEALLQRHGPLVWSVCRRVLGEEHAAEDAFQATFLVLVRKARSVNKQASICSWLHGVALRVALRARQQEQLRHRREQETPIRSPTEANWPDIRPILDEEIQRLPEKYRLPIILCYLEGQTNDEAARLLNCPRGTVATRLARARERLRSQLLRRGVTLSAGTLTAYLTDNVMSAAVPPLLLVQTAKIALTGATSVAITTLTEGVLHAMFLSKVKMTSAFVLVLAALGGAGMGKYYLSAQRLPEPWEVPEAASKSTEPRQNYERFVKDLKEAPVMASREQVLPAATLDKSMAGKPEEQLQKLLKARRDAAEQAWRVRYELYRAGANEPGTGTPVTLHMLLDASKCWLKAELEVSNKKADHLAARERYLKFIKEVVKVTIAQYNVGRISKAALASALYEQLNAEIELEREKARK